MDQHHLVTRFSDAGRLAALCQADLGAIPRIRSLCAARQQTTYACASLFVTTLTVCAGGHLIGGMSMLFATWAMGIGLCLHMSSVAHTAWLLTPARSLNVARQIEEMCQGSGRALVWLQDVARSGRDLYGFDIEIMEMIEQSEQLRKR